MLIKEKLVSQLEQEKKSGRIALLAFQTNISLTSSHLLSSDSSYRSNSNSNSDEKTSIQIPKLVIENLEVSTSHQALASSSQATLPILSPILSLPKIVESMRETNDRLHSYLKMLLNRIVGMPHFERLLEADYHMTDHILGNSCGWPDYVQDLNLDLEQPQSSIFSQTAQVTVQVLKDVKLGIVNSLSRLSFKNLQSLKSKIPTMVKGKQQVRRKVNKFGIE